MTDRAAKEPLRFAVIGLDHAHGFDIARHLQAAGAVAAAFHSHDEAAARFAADFPTAKRATEVAQILEDPTIALVVSAAIPHLRAPLGIAAMRHGKDFLSDKPGFTSLAQLEQARLAHAETGRRYAVYFSERLANRATVAAGRLVAAGAIGRVVHMIGLGPHRVGLFERPDWFWDPARAGGILADLASHQMDQFLHFTGATNAEVVSASVGNVRHPERPAFEDVGEVTVAAPGAVGTARVDWLTPAGLGAWGDGRTFLLGTEGTIELRKVCDPAGRSGGDHLFLVDRHGTHYHHCSAEPLPFAADFLRDLQQGSDEALPQAHCFLASELALRAQAQARRLEPRER